MYYLSNRSLAEGPGICFPLFSATRMSIPSLESLILSCSKQAIITLVSSIFGTSSTDGFPRPDDCNTAVDPAFERLPWTDGGTDAMVSFPSFRGGETSC